MRRKSRGDSVIRGGHQIGEASLGRELNQIVISAQRPSFLTINEFVGAGEHHEVYRSKPPLTSKPAEHFEAIHPRHLNIAKDDTSRRRRIGAIAKRGEMSNRLCPIRERHQWVSNARFGDPSLNEEKVVGVVINHDDREKHSRRVGRWMTGGIGGLQINATEPAQRVSRKGCDLGNNTNVL